MTTTKSHTAEKIGGTSMSRSKELLDTVLIGDRSEDALYNRILVVSAYAGVTDSLLEHKKTGEPGVYTLFAGAEGGWIWGDALNAAAERMQTHNATVFAADDSARQTADRFVRERIEGVRSCMIDLARLCSFGHFQLEHHLLTVREMLCSLGEAQSAFNTVLLLNLHGVNARLIDLTGWREGVQHDLDECIRRAFADVDLSRELPIVTGYAQCTEALMRSYDRGYSEVTLSRVAVVTQASEAIIHKEFHLSSADPRIVGTGAVRVIGATNYDVADQLSNMGMEAIHPRAAKSLRQAGIPLRVRNAFEPDHEGTLIRADLAAQSAQVEIVTGLKNVFAFEFYDQNMVGVKGYDAEILEALTRHKVWILSKTSNANTITHFLKGSMKAIKRVESDLSKAYPNAEITLRKVALISAIGRNIADPTILARAIDALAKAEIAPLGVHALVRKVDLQVIIEEADFELAVTSLHRELIETRQLAATDCVSPLNAAA
ncbi:MULTISPECIES: aspartate kinase [Aminobacter]|jgi:aspartate kinase|uniref:aspartate kinase n=1 Tax=Aminobacter aminovorans TaxID=83263 RepID=A0AAC8YUA9_AMIAI|nr:MULTISPECIES: aspartate kinase [Aminobacter]AMS44605.1 Aspartokinase associated with ectoine biosynthesis [Aminobacter aminovorans]MBB3708380.1 aspartate kinase [Aminobacter aminovorans]WMD00319.1 aspartate kinase [Aminobacter niigataensis]